MPKNEAIMRHELLVYLNIKSNDTAKYSLMGNGFTDLTTAGNPTTSGNQYVHQSSASTRVTGYAPTMAFTGEVFDSDEANEYIQEIADNWDIGEKAYTDFVQVKTWKPSGDSEVEFEATKQDISISIDNPGSGASGAALGLTGSLNFIGAPIKGTFNIETQTFTPATAAAQANVRSGIAPASAVTPVAETAKKGK